MKNSVLLLLIILLLIVGVFMFFSKETSTISTNQPPKVVTTPGSVLQLSNWKLTLPKGPDGKPIEIKNPELTDYDINPWFMVNNAQDGVQFRAPVKGVTTDNSDYLRSELREMTNNGTENANWSSTSGTHTMFLDEAITAVPKNKPHVVAGQIHDDSDDVIVIRLEYPNLYINVDGENIYVLDDSYTLGKRFTIKFEVNNDQTNVYYNGSAEPVYTLAKNYSDAYFKAGVYTQSNCSKEGEALCRDNNFGEVILYDVQVSHQ